MQYGLIGEKLGHSFSKQIHGMLGDYAYDLKSLPQEELGPFLCDGQWLGLNVTIPYKQAVIPYCDTLTKTAQAIGSVNTLVRRNGKIIGDNTDLYGLCAMAKRAGITFLNKKVLILGSGGTSLTAQAAAKNGGAKQIVVVSRKGQDNYENISRHSDVQCIINTTPVGMFPNSGESLADLNRFPQCSGVLDVIYNPLRTKLLLDAKELGIPHSGGLFMLVAQAKKASELFAEKEIDDQKIEQIHAVLEKQLTNIVLIGMPGCGKTTIGRAIADSLKRKHADVDELIAQQAGMMPAQIIREQGEKAFRRFETEILAEVGKQTGIVISTGGGAVTMEENYLPLKQNGLLFFIERDLERLPTQGRPLSQGLDALTQLYQTRLPLYLDFADHRIDGNGTVEQTAKKIMEVFNESACD